MFADEKLVKGTDIFSNVRRDPLTGEVPDNKGPSVNRSNCWNNFAACSIKKHLLRPFEYVMIEDKGDSYFFLECVSHLVAICFLERGDIFVIDNCTIHMSGGCEFLQEIFWVEHGILMVPPPPHHPELNPIELIFNDLVSDLRLVSSRWNAMTQEDFNDTV